MPNEIDDLLNPGFISPGRMDLDTRKSIASQCRATASNELCSRISVDGGTGLMKDLLLDAAAAIEVSLIEVTLSNSNDALQREKGTIVEADLQNEIDLLRAETLELNRAIDNLKGEITPLKGGREEFLQLVAERFKKLQRARDALELAAVRFGNLSLHDDSMRNGVIPSAGCDEAMAAAHQITWYLEGNK